MPSKYRRKIIKIGKTSYGIILPIAWLRYHRLDENSKLQVISNDRIIITKCGDTSDMETSNEKKGQRHTPNLGAEVSHEK